MQHMMFEILRQAQDDNVFWMWRFAPARHTAEEHPNGRRLLALDDPRNDALSAAGGVAS